MRKITLTTTINKKTSQYVDIMAVNITLLLSRQQTFVTL